MACSSWVLSVWKFCAFSWVFSVISSPLFSSFENFCHSSFGPSGLVLRFFLPVIFQLPVLLFRKFLRLYLLNLLLSFSFVFWMFLSWRHGRVCVKHIYVHIYNWFLSWLKYAVFPLRMSRIILKVLLIPFQWKSRLWGY